MRVCSGDGAQGRSFILLPVVSWGREQSDSVTASLITPAPQDHTERLCVAPAI